jgi:hypothetical protein
MIIVRKKEQEVPENHQSARIVRYFYVTSGQYLIDKMPTIISLCEIEKARAYINLNGKDTENIGTQINYLAGLYLKNNEKRGWKSIYDKAFSNLPNVGNKKWLIDVDNVAGEFNDVDFLDMLQTLQPIGGKFITYVPTPNGKHIITIPFNLQEFLKIKGFPITFDDVKKEAPTVLYFPNSLTII